MRIISSNLINRIGKFFSAKPIVPQCTNNLSRAEQLFKAVKADARTAEVLDLAQHELCDAPFAYSKNAPDEIAKLAGSKNAQVMQEYADKLKQMILRSHNSGYEMLSKENIKKLYFDKMFSTLNPDEFDSNPFWFAEIHAALIYRFGKEAISQKNILELGCSFAPYLHFLKNVYRNDAVGIDMNPFATEYARKNGVQALQGDCRNLPFKESSFDVVFSRHFLEFLYLDQLSSGSESTSPSFIRSTIFEVMRVLRPGGVYVSYFEADIKADIMNLHHFSSGMSLELLPGKTPVYIFTK